MFKKLTWIADADRRQWSSGWAALAVAQGSRARLEIAMFAFDPAIALLRPVSRRIFALSQRAYLQERAGWLADQEERLRAVRVTVSTHLSWAPKAASAILAHLADPPPDLVILGADHETRAGERFGALDLQLMRRCPVPLLLVRRQGKSRPRRVLAAIDPFQPAHRRGSLNWRVLETARNYADAVGARLHVVHAVAPGPAPGPAHLESVRDRVRMLAAEFKVEASCCDVIDGEPAQVIEQAIADSRADVLVLGAPSRGRLHEALAAGTARRLIHVRACDLLTVAPAPAAPHSRAKTQG